MEKKKPPGFARMEKNKHSCHVLGEFKLYSQYYKAFGRIYSESKQSSCPLTHYFFFLGEKSETSMNIYAQISSLQHYL